MLTLENCLYDLQDRDLGGKRALKLTDGDGDVVLPGAEGFVVRSGNEAAVFVDEGNGVDGLEMMVVFLGHFTRAGVKLDDLFIRRANEKFVRVSGGVEAEDVRHAFDLEARSAGASLGVPKKNPLVVGAGEEVGTRRTQGGVRDRLGVPRIGSQ